VLRLSAGLVGADGCCAQQQHALWRILGMPCMQHAIGCMLICLNLPATVYSIDFLAVEVVGGGGEAVGIVGAYRSLPDSDVSAGVPC
jgi:hypothetical protein